ncbi:GNAT family N-acetyltransferase [Pseudomonas sp. F1_0610]|uniref:GNAT family N-acetyltransferase n=1 Tax=Pseudomonas sp. F1_0610 TaxID=3114284 RepID=UPI0039C08FE7
MLTTQRCAMAPLQEADKLQIQRLYLDTQVRRYLGGAISISLYEDKFAAMLADTTGHYLVIREQKTSHVVGLISLTSTDQDPTVGELSYLLMPSYWRQGYAFESLSAVVQSSYITNYRQLVAETQVLNQASNQLLMRLGFHLEKQITRFSAIQNYYYLNV